MAADDKLAVLYNLLEAMDKAGADVKEKHESEYKEAIESVKTSQAANERLLASTIVAKFFKHFPEHEEAAFDSIVDLCESADVSVRKRATQALVEICTDRPQLVSKAADILIQLYQTNQPSEVNLIDRSLTTLLELNIAMFLESFFANFDDGSEIVRERALKLLSNKIQTVSSDAMTKEVEEKLLKYSTKAMQDVTKNEFMVFIGILSKLKIAKTSSGHKEIVAVIREQADLKKDFDPSDSDSMDKFLLCTQQTLPFLSQFNTASEYISYICEKIFPHLKALAAGGRDLSILQALAELSPFVVENDTPELIDLGKCQKAVFEKLIEYLPLPEEESPVAMVSEEAEKPKEEETSIATKEDGDAAATDTSEVKSAETDQEKQTDAAQQPSQLAKQTDFQFTHIEYLLYTFLQLCRVKSDLISVNSFLTPAVNKRILNLTNGCSKYVSALEAQLTSGKSKDLNKEENKLISVALRTTRNISNMIRVVMKKSYSNWTPVTLSCKPVAPPQTTTSSSATSSSSSNATNQHNRPQQQHSNGNNSANNNNNNGKSGNFNNRYGGQKNKYRQNFSAGYNKRPRYAR